jgi:hypothetical protein
MPLLRRKVIFGTCTILEKKVYFGKDLILERRPNFGVHTIDGNKETCIKKGKETCKRKKRGV